MTYDHAADWAERRDERDHEEDMVELWREEKECLTLFNKDICEWVEVWFTESGYREIYRAAMALRLLLQTKWQTMRSVWQTLSGRRKKAGRNMGTKIDVRCMRRMLLDLSSYDDGEPDKSRKLEDLAFDMLSFIEEATTRAIIIPLPEIECKAS